MEEINKELSELVKIEIEKLKVEKEERVNAACSNFLSIVKKNLPDKYSYLDEWLLKKSKLMLKESEDKENLSPIKKATFTRGTIIKVDFGVNLGSEMSQMHFAVVVSKNDNPKRDAINVIPLSSKENKHYLKIEYDIFDKLIEESETHKNYINLDKKQYKREYFSHTITKSKFNRLISEANQKLSVIDSNISYYKNHLKQTSVCINQMTTVAKTKIQRPRNEFDLLEKNKMPTEEMNKIDDHVIKEYTNIELSSYTKV